MKSNFAQTYPPKKKNKKKENIDIFGSPAIKKARIRFKGNHILKQKIIKKNIKIIKIATLNNKLQILGSDLCLYVTDLSVFVDNYSIQNDYFKIDHDELIESSFEEDADSSNHESMEGEEEEDKKGIIEKMQEEEEEEYNGSFEKIDLKKMNKEIFDEYYDIVNCAMFRNLEEGTELDETYLYLCSDSGALCEVDLKVRLIEIISLFFCFEDFLDIFKEDLIFFLDRRNFIFWPCTRRHYYFHS